MIPLHRLWLVCMASMTVFFLVIARLGYLQIYCHKDLSRRADREHTRPYVEVSRRAIFDRAGHVLAMSIGGGSCYADPKRIKSPLAAARALAPILNVSVSSLETKLSQRKRFVWLARRLDPEHSRLVGDLKIAGVSVVTESKRFYPEETLAAHVLGIVGADHRGASGVEQTAESWLSGRSTPYTFASWNVSKTPGTFVTKRDAIPQSIVLTLDRTLQYIVEQELALQMQMSRARAGTVIIQDPQTGEILAMASAPTFNPNLWGSNRVDSGYTVDALKNFAVERVVEPGSTFKIVTTAAALDQSVVTPQDSFFCENGKWQIHGRTIHDHEKDGWLRDDFPTENGKVRILNFFIFFHHEGHSSKCGATLSKLARAPFW